MGDIVGLIGLAEGLNVGASDVGGNVGTFVGFSDGSELGISDGIDEMEGTDDGLVGLE